MVENINLDVLDWYKKFVNEENKEDDHTSPNFLTKIDENELRKFQDDFGKILPEAYVKFLVSVGSGRIRQDANGRFDEFHDNLFLNTSEISAILRKESVEWEVYPDLVADGEVPFFYLGDNAVLVFRKDKGSKVYYPHLDDVYAESFEDFTRKLMNNIDFYTEI
ncbi:SMI1/KNR4 family protein [Ensifer sp. ENS06]|uniref:SMI1/KNR4 family protein n=1 Tax=Ensifer sp. ENS06 TaxID=2769276 RepID=UPI00177F53FB|nr:SMI1/KNR4 family protein [Ensifer sp. ENS06]MBD9624012.1 SMI1/KNR4 family protein [Ensifer sp. ENS06]